MTKNKYWAYFDEAWKKIIERFFPQFLCFFVPDLYETVDFSKGIDFLDKEMEQSSIFCVKGAKYVDKLAKVYLKSGEDQWILVHIEVQGQYDKEFPSRMFRYFYRIFDRHGKEIVSMAILTGSEKKIIEGKYELKSYGSGVEFRYLSFRLMDYDKERLEQDSNPIAIVILASQERERAKRKGERFNIKLYLIRKLYDKGYGKDEIQGLFEFIDWVMQLNDKEENLIWEEIKELEEVKKMPYVTSVERIGIKKGLQQGMHQGLEQGLQQGLHQMIIEALDERFGKVPSTISSTVNQIKDGNVLKFLLRQVIRCNSIEEFKQALNRQN